MENSLNPYYNGTNSMSLLFILLLLQKNIVLILIIMEHTQ